MQELKTIAAGWRHWEGRTIDGFPLAKYLGGSDHSCVFLTERAGREPRRAAIKFILADRENPDFQLSWWEQIAKHRHPHLIQLFERGLCQVDGTNLVYCVMEYCEENLVQLLPHRPLTPEETSDMLRSVLDVLGYIHSRGFVHAHIKPANILAGGDQVKLSSDGLCGMDEVSRALGPRSIYTPPEIASGARISPACDVWSLGIVLVEALTQRPPVWKEAEPANPLVPQTVPEPFLEIATHCLRRDPLHRWTILQIAAGLEQSPAIVENQVEPRGPKRAYMIPVVAAILLLAMAAGPRLLKYQRSTEHRAGGMVESIKTQSRAQQSPGTASGTENKAAINTSADSPAQGGFVPGSVAEQSLPVVPRSASNTIHGKIRVRLRVTVNSSGEVVAAKFDSRGPSEYFAKLALKSAQGWKFTPPRVDGHNISSEWILRFEFGRTETNVYPRPVGSA